MVLIYILFLEGGSLMAKRIIGGAITVGEPVDKCPGTFRTALKNVSITDNSSELEEQTIRLGCYYNGEGVAQDYAKELEWYTKGVASEKKYEESFKVRRKAAEQGVADAQ